MRTPVALLIALLAAAPVQAQSKADTLQQSGGSGTSHRLTFGVSSGTMHFGDGGHEQGVSAAVGAALPHGFSIGINPTYAWAQAAPTTDAVTGRLVPSLPVHGVADLPVSIGFSHALPGAASSGFDVSLGVTLPTGDMATMGSGQTAMGGNLDLWVEPVSGWSVSAGAGHTLSNDFASGLGSIAPTTVSIGTSHALGAVSLNLGYSTEMGAMPAGTTHSRNLSGGASLPLAGNLALTVAGSTGRADGATSWALSAGLGTTFADVGQVSPVAAFRSLANALGAGRSMGSSRSAAAKAAAAMKKASHGHMKV